MYITIFKYIYIHIYTYYTYTLLIQSKRPTQSLYVCGYIIGSRQICHGHGAKEVNISKALETLRDTAHELNGSHWTMTWEPVTKWMAMVDIRFVDPPMTVDVYILHSFPLTHPMVAYTMLYITGWWFGTWILWLSMSWECHHPNWLIFFRGVGIISTGIFGSIWSRPNKKFEAWNGNRIRGIIPI